MFFIKPAYFLHLIKTMTMKVRMNFNENDSIACNTRTLNSYNITLTHYISLKYIKQLCMWYIMITRQAIRGF